jgi:hypothetical protein
MNLQSLLLNFSYILETQEKVDTLVAENTTEEETAESHTKSYKGLCRSLELVEAAKLTVNTKEFNIAFRELRKRGEGKRLPTSLIDGTTHVMDMEVKHRFGKEGYTVFKGARLGDEAVVRHVRQNTWKRGSHPNCVKHYFRTTRISKACCVVRGCDADLMILSDFLKHIKDAHDLNTAQLEKFLRCVRNHFK